MQQITFADRKVLVVGMGMSGRSAVEFLLAHEASVHGIDRDAQLLANHPEIQALKQAGLTVCSEKDFQNIAQFDLVVLSPGIPLNHFVVQSAQQAKVSVIGEIELGCQVAKNSMLGITGTNGKTTVTLLVTHVLKHCGQLARALGNVGIPFTRELLNIDPQKMIVLELSSYQIEMLYHRCLEAGLILNITPDHLDRYQTMEAYAKAKCEIERSLKSESHLYMEEKAWQQYGHLLKNKKPHLYGYCKTSFIHTDLTAVFRDGKQAFELPPALKNKKSHNLENLLAAYALCADRGITGTAFLEAWQSFKKPGHRIEFVMEHQGVRYYDDSKGTNIDAVSRAVQSLEGPIILIAGGVDKCSPYTPWLEEFRDKVKLICAIGQSAGKIHEQLASKIPVMMFNSLDEAVQQAAQYAQRGESVLLSPGCSSFDMFKDYTHRGNEFQRIVRELA
jgi:UDP-N-acetylmuramoylalanine--D-glutamate ligase